MLRSSGEKNKRIQWRFPLDRKHLHDTVMSLSVMGAAASILLLQRWKYGRVAQKGKVSCVSQCSSFISAVGSSNNFAAHLVVSGIIKLTDFGQRLADFEVAPWQPLPPAMIKLLGPQQNSLTQVYDARMMYRMRILRTAYYCAFFSCFPMWLFLQGDRT